jgi:hypothetical protein
MQLSNGATFAMVATALLALAVPARARAQSDDDAAEEDPAAAEPAADAPREGIEAGGFDDYETASDRQKRIAPEFGLGVRFRTIYIPKFVIELFYEEATSSVFKPGFGLELSRRKGNFELVIGVEYENLSPDDGFFLGKDADPNVPEQAPDFVVFDDFSWVAADVAFLFSAPINKKLAFRYGAGLGIGVVLGEVRQTDSTCAAGTDDIQTDCMANPNGMQVDEAADLPPVLPVVDLLAGLQWRPAEKLTINLEGGLRSAAFLGLSSILYF